MSADPPVFPKALDDDDDDVTWALQTAGVQWERGGHADAVVWLRRAAEAALEAGEYGRSADLQRTAREIDLWLKLGHSGGMASEADDDGVDALLEEDIPVLETQTLDGPTPSLVDAMELEAAGAAEGDVDISDLDVEELADEEIIEEPLESLPPVADTGDPPLPSFPLSSIPPLSLGPDELEPEDSATALLERAPTSERLPESKSAPVFALTSKPAPKPSSVPTPAPTPEPEPELPPAPALPLESERPPPRPPSTSIEEESPDEPTLRPPPKAAPEPRPPALVLSAPPTPAAAPEIALADAAPPASQMSEPPSSLAEPPPEGIDAALLESVAGLEDLPPETQVELAAQARVRSLAIEQEVGGFGLLLVLEGVVAVMPAITDAVIGYAKQGEPVFQQGSLETSVALRAVAGMDGARVATWQPEDFLRMLEACPWVADELHEVADRFQALAGAAMGPLGEQMDDGMRGMITDRCEVKKLLAGDVVMQAGEPVVGLHVVGAGELELVENGGVTRRLGPGDLLFPSGVLSHEPAPAEVRAGAAGALLLYADRMTTHELVVSVPPLLELVAMG